MEKIKTAIKTFEAYFDNFELRPPSTDHDIESFRKYYKDLSDEIINFYKYCDGFNVKTQDSFDGNVLSLNEHLELFEQLRSEEEQLFSSQFPLLSDGCGNYDCILFRQGHGNNSVVFWDSDYGLPQCLKASSLNNYITFLADDLIQRYNQDGSIKSNFDIENPNYEEPDWPFNTSKMIKKDPGLIELYKDATFAMEFNDPEEFASYLK